MLHNKIFPFLMNLLFPKLLSLTYVTISCRVDDVEDILKKILSLH